MNKRPESPETEAKERDDRPMLITTAVVLVLLFCLMGLTMDYGWFGYGRAEPVAAVTPIVTTVSVPSAPAAAADGIVQVNVNTASAKELEALPGVGEVIAQRIVDYRAANGPFASVDELVHVKGIGAATLEKLRPYADV